MSERRDPVRRPVEQLVPAVVGTNDWTDVVRRAEAGPRLGAPRIPGRLNKLAVVLLAALLVAVPSLAATGTLHAFWRHSRLEIDLATQLRDAQGAHAGGVQIRLPGVLATNDRGSHLLPHRMLHTRNGLVGSDTYPLHWRLALRRGSAQRGQVVYRQGVAHAGTVIAELCRRCKNGDTGEVDLTRTQAALLLNGQLAFRFETVRGALGGNVARPKLHGLLPHRR